MRSLLWIIILFALAAGVAVLSHRVDGSAHLVLQETMYSMNLGTFILALLILSLALWLVFKIIFTIAGLPGGFRRWNRNRRQARADQILNEIGMTFFEGEYSKTQKLADKLLSNQEAGEKQPLALLLAAYAAQECADVPARTRFLNMLNQKSIGQLPVHLLLAQDALQRSSYDEATQHLQAAQKIHPNLPNTLKLDLRRAIEQNEYDTIIKHTHQLQKMRALSQDEAIRSRKLAYQTMLNETNDIAGLRQCVKKIADNERSDDIAIILAKKYCQLGQYKDAVSVLRKQYNETENFQLLQTTSTLFPSLPVSLQKEILENFENLLKQDNKNVHLLIALGKMTGSKNLWGKAKGYLEAALSIESSAEVHWALVQIFTGMENTELAEKHRQLALEELAQNNQSKV